MTVNTLPSIHRDPGPSLPSLERSPGSPTIPVIVIIIVQELEFDDVESVEAAALIAGAPSLLADSADPGEEPPPRNNKIARTEAKHRNLTSRLNVPSSRPGQGALNCRDLFSQKNLFQRTATCFPAWLSRRWLRPGQQQTSRRNLTARLNVPSNHPGQDASSRTLPPL